MTTTAALTATDFKVADLALALRGIAKTFPASPAPVAPISGGSSRSAARFR